MSTRWQKNLISGAHDLNALIVAGAITPDDATALQPVLERYEFGISSHYLSLMDPDDPRCPIRLQAIPDVQELEVQTGEESDPVGDARHGAPPLLVHRYPDRALLMPTLRCPLYCRFCFRKVLLNEGPAPRLGQELEEAMAYLRAHPAIHEVILSGGDPLLLGDSRLQHILEGIRCIPHIRRIRIHSRVPATLPQRFTPELISLLERHAPITIVNHVNHPLEIAKPTRAAWHSLRRAGVLLLSQSVLMRDINDDPEILESLFEDMMDEGVKPYYLHHLDPTVGTSHFRVSLDRGISLMNRLRGRISGTALPAYVMELPGGGGKVRVDSSAVQRGSREGLWHLTGPFGDEVLYDESVLGIQTGPAQAPSEFTGSR